ncbi:MAG TPA: hypothetical protein VEM14_08535 [Gemmatimonadaceae bacterium]|nr:hypothetical protein [Gemmatimonadaceae bacterium]
MKRSRVSTLALVGLANAFLAGTALSQQQSGAASGDARTQAIVASFNKSKHVIKEKRGVRKEKYLDVRSVPATKQNLVDYSGTYEASVGFRLRLRVDAGGRVEGTGSEPVDDAGTVQRTFSLRNGVVNGALIKATKVYADGTSEPLEGVFINKTVFESPTDKGVTAFGLGVVGQRYHVGGLDLDRVFYELRQ